MLSAPGLCFDECNSTFDLKTKWVRGTSFRTYSSGGLCWVWYSGQATSISLTMSFRATTWKTVTRCHWTTMRGWSTGPNKWS